MKTKLFAFACLLGGPTAAFSAVTLTANTTTNNGLTTGAGMFFDISTTTSTIQLTSLTTASTAAADASFTLTVYTRSGSSLGGPVTSGPGSAATGWTLLGTVNAVQGATVNGISLPIDIPDIGVAAGDTVGVALVFTGAGPRYSGTGTPALQTFSDGTLTLVTGDSRTVPFTTGGGFFSSRSMTGSLTYDVVPESSSAALIALGLTGAISRRRRPVA